MNGVGCKGLSLLVDTNVWVDFFIDRGKNHDSAVSLVKAAIRNEVPLFTSIEATKDIYYIVGSELKRMQREGAGSVSTSFAQAVNEAAWSCLNTVRRQSTVVAADVSDLIEALSLKSVHGDYEDNLVVAAAMRARATHIVSSDTTLQARSPVPCIGIVDALELLD